MRPVIVRHFPIYRSLPRTRLTFLFFVSFYLLPTATVKAYGELPENAKINETETFGEEEGECTFEFGDEEEVDIDDI